MPTLFLAPEKRYFIIVFQLETLSQHTSFQQKNPKKTKNQNKPGFISSIIFLLLEKKILII